MIYATEGSGTLNTKNSEIIKFKEKDVVLIDKREVYYWNGNCTIAMPCTPAWYPEQYKMTD